MEEIYDEAIITIFKIQIEVINSWGSVTLNIFFTIQLLRLILL